MPVHFRTNIEIWNYQKLCEEIDTHIRDFFLSNDGVSQDDIIVLNYKNALIKRLSSLDNAKQLFSGLNISEINDIFINVKTTISRYSTILPAIENPANAGLLRSLSTLDMILQARNIFCQIFQSKHINQEIFSSVGMNILLKSTFGYSDVTLYCLSYHLSDITNDGMFLQYFIGKKLNTRWDRIVYKDIDHMRLKAMLSPNIYNRIKRKQRQNKIYIDKQFKEPAILHLSDGLKV